MISMQGVPSALIARSESWVRKQAQALVSRLPANVERADLIQVGLIAVAQAAIGFEWDGDRESAEAREAFVRYAQRRVKGAMLDELRQMDELSRPQRRKIKVVQIARERWRVEHGTEPALSQLAERCKMDIAEVARLDQLAEAATKATPHDDEDEFHDRDHPATEKDEVEARVDTAIVMRRLEQFFAGLSESERQVIDAYLGVGLSPVDLASSMKVTPSRVSQIYGDVVRRAARHFGATQDQRAIDRVERPAAPSMDELVALREQVLREAQGATEGWGELLQDVLRRAPQRDNGTVRQLAAPAREARPLRG